MMEHPVQNLSVCLVNLAAVEVYVDVRDSISPMPETSGNRILGNVERSGHRSPGMARPIGCKFLDFYSVINGVEGHLDFRETMTEPHVKASVILVFVKHEEQKGIAFVPLDDLHCLRLYFYGIRFVSLCPHKVNPAILNFTEVAEINYIDADKTEEKLENVPVHIQFIGKFRKEDLPKHFDRHGAFSCRFRTQLEDAERVSGGYAVIDGVIEYSPYVPEVNVSCITGWSCRHKECIEVCKPLARDVLERKAVNIFWSEFPHTSESTPIFVTGILGMTISEAQQTSREQPILAFIGVGIENLNYEILHLCCGEALALPLCHQVYDDGINLQLALCDESVEHGLLRMIYNFSNLLVPLIGGQFYIERKICAAAILVDSEFQRRGFPFCGCPAIKIKFCGNHSAFKRRVLLQVAVYLRLKLKQK